MTNRPISQDVKTNQDMEKNLYEGVKEELFLNWGLMSRMKTRNRGATMKTHMEKLQAWIDDNWDMITFLAEADEKGVDFVRFIDVVSLMRKSNKAEVDVDNLTTYIIRHKSSEVNEGVQHV